MRGLDLTEDLDRTSAKHSRYREHQYVKALFLLGLMLNEFTVGYGLYCVCICYGRNRLNGNRGICEAE